MMSNRRLDASWRAWLDENIARACDPDGLLGILLDNHFTLDSIRESMGKHFPAHSPRLGSLREERNGVDYKALCAVGTTLQRREGAVGFPSAAVQLYTVAHFLSAEECDAIAAVIQDNLHPSTITVEAPNDRYFRTSSTADLLGSDRRIAPVEEKIARALGIRLAYSENLQGQHYAVGQQFKPHTDFFEPGTEEYRTFGGSRGNRTWTFMVFLNDVARGGGTHFVNLGQVFLPRKGQALIWNNLYADGTPNYDTLHAGLPVEQGHKVIITKWFREWGPGSMFDEQIMRT